MTAATGRHVIVVGGGIAGSNAALAASAAGADVTLVTGSGLLDSNTAHAQGGIAAAIGPDDSPALHAADTIAAGAGLSDPGAVRVLTREGATAVRALIAAGAPFDRIADARAADDRAADARVALGLEAAHSRQRILHAGGDASGRMLADWFAQRLADSGVTVREHEPMRDLVVRDGAVVGVLTDHGVLDADSVVLATGGLGALYPTTSNPAVARGSGLAAAWRAGAVLADLEFVQFHPTTIPAAGGFLLSEAVRGAGAVIVDEGGRRFLFDADPRGELAPRDVVAAAIEARIRAQQGRPVLLDATGIEQLAERFPSIDRTLHAVGIDWTREPVPVAPAAHFAMGGIATDLDGRTSLPGLLVAGECARTGVHGANRLASNSLLEGLVFGVRAGRAAAGDQRAADLRLEIGSVDDPGAESDSAGPRWSTVADALAGGVGILRDADGLSAAVGSLDALAAADEGGRTGASVARLIARAALARRESRGAHRRADHPRTAAVSSSRGWVRGWVRGARAAEVRERSACSRVA